MQRTLGQPDRGCSASGSRMKQVTYAIRLPKNGCTTSTKTGTREKKKKASRLGLAVRFRLVSRWTWFDSSSAVLSSKVVVYGHCLLDFLNCFSCLTTLFMGLAQDYQRQALYLLYDQTENNHMTQTPKEEVP